MLLDKKEPGGERYKPKHYSSISASDIKAKVWDQQGGGKFLIFSEMPTQITSLSSAFLLVASGYIHCCENHTVKYLQEITESAQNLHNLSRQS